LHSATILTAAAGAELRRLAYRAFGEEAENIGSGSAPKYSYTGKERDSSSLMYYGARYYDPALSRFITPDTPYDRGPQGLNRYSYALNNPIRYNDPSGHMSNPFAVMFRGLQESPVGQFVGNLMRDEAQATAEAAVHQVTPPEQDSGMVEGFVPVWGDAKDSYLALKEGKFVYGMLFAGMAVSDIIDGGVSPEDAAKAGIRAGSELGEELAKNKAIQTIQYGTERLFKSGKRQQRAQTIVNEAAQAAGVTLGNYVDDVVFTTGDCPFFDVINGRRTLALNEGALRKTRAGQLIDALHELSHARHSVKLGALSYDNLYFSSLSSRARIEMLVESRAMKTAERYLQGLTPQQKRWSNEYIKSWGKYYIP
ncbi:MAG: RHS repeat-associated core domain-containing protein, partial [bacterium]|nr:RHS repeat-associated core domain-containing protein [bacterium]